MTAVDVDPRQPVLVGLGTFMQRHEDFTAALEPMDLMIEAVRRAASDATGANAAQLLAGTTLIAVPRGRWRYRNPAGEIARAIGADNASTVLAGLGVLQQTLIGNACARIASGEVHTAIVAGADTGYRILQARKAGQRAEERQQQDEPDVSLEPADALLHPAEVRAGLKMPVALYAMIESALRARHRLSVQAHRDMLGDMYARFSEISAANPEAWRRTPVGTATIRDGSPSNPMQAFPYTRLHCASWNVDQAGALVLCSAARARELGIDQWRWVYAMTSTESNHMTAVSARADIAGCTGATLAAQAALDSCEMAASGIDFLELYSCFPVAVEMYAEALGVDLQSTRDLTVTGGMPFAGGPFNNYVLQSTCRMGTLLRRKPGSTGMVSSVSGILTKQAFGLWSTLAPSRGFAHIDVSSAVAQQAEVREVDDAFSGPCVVAAYTVVHEKETPAQVMAILDTPGGSRAIASSEDPAMAARAEDSELCGLNARVDAGRLVLA